MSRFPNFWGGSNVERSINANLERTINAVVQLTPGNPKADPWGLKRPGLTPWLQIGAGPHRASFQQDNLAWLVSGNLFVEIFANQTYTIRGLVAVDGNPATICSNGGADGSGGHQLLIVSGGKTYIYDLVSRVFQEVITPDTPGPWLMGIYINGSFLRLQSNGDKIFFSALLNGDNSSWPGLNVLQVFQQPGNVASIIASHNELWPWSATQVNPWYSTSETSVFTPVPGASIEYGIFAPFSAVRMDNSLLWISQTDEGGALVRRSQGYSAPIVSTPAINRILQDTPNVDLAVGFTIQMDGHYWYLLYLPNGETTLVYDASIGEWYEWATWDSATNQWTPFIGRTHMFAFDKHLIGARDSGWLYAFDWSTHEDTLKV